MVVGKSKTIQRRESHDDMEHGKYKNARGGVDSFKCVVFAIEKCANTYYENFSYEEASRISTEIQSARDRYTDFMADTAPGVEALSILVADFKNNVFELYSKPSHQVLSRIRTNTSSLKTADLDVYMKHMKDFYIDFHYYLMDFLLYISVVHKRIGDVNPEIKSFRESAYTFYSECITGDGTKQIFDTTYDLVVDTTKEFLELHEKITNDFNIMVIREDMDKVKQIFQDYFNEKSI
ncbi:hypothetical protein AX774_g5968 [Zancudomyces culisetae]|uniref:Uncharacterized protein n=1 Tax=Zancudomyces culisetae TaxID=1213189 RepID=A0A1R1PI00_ZANCU|nr:hypothetical protein AX774_g5968 [Zancudomyces culisetae]|eukprot:OMH80586.1 hypothetical protein AX774_g5968 [Zancudomyces culisetae]